MAVFELRFFHGGSYQYYSPWSPAVLAVSSRLVAQSGYACLSVDYRKAPEHLFPDPVTDAVTALQWLCNPKNGPPCTCKQCTSTKSNEINETVQGGDPKILLCGDSAGGGLAVLTALLAAKDKHLHSCIVGLGLFSPWVDFSCSLPSYETRAWDQATNRGDPVFSSGNGVRDRKEGVRSSETLLRTSQGWSVQDERVSPIFAPKEVLAAALPRCRIHVGDAEVMLDESIELANRANNGDKGRDISCIVWDCMWHDFVYYAEGCYIREDDSNSDVLLEAHAAIDDIAKYFQKWIGEVS